jgi:hypothetical protein
MRVHGGQPAHQRMPEFGLMGGWSGGGYCELRIGSSPPTALLKELKMRMTRHIPIDADDFEQFRQVSESEREEHSGLSRQCHDREQSHKTAGEEPTDFDSFVPRWWRPVRHES